MADEPIGTVHQTLHLVLDYWHVIAMIFGGIIGYSWWIINQIFATNSDIYKCKAEISQLINENRRDNNKRFIAFNEHNDRKHQEISESVDWIKNYIIKKDM